VRPLVLGALDGGGYVLASETAALDIVGATLLREVEPGELIAIDADGLRSRRFARATPSFCVFEYVYLARPDHRTPETSVYAARRRMGQMLAEESPTDADLVIGVPDSGLAAAAGYSQASGIPYAEGLVKNRYVGRTFIQPSQSLRQLGIRLKLNPLRDVLEGQRLVVVDDSIVRGNTSRQLVRMLREAGATEVHLRIPSPPVRNPCYYGIDMATKDELLASGRSTSEICASLEADSLAYLSLDALISASRRPAGSLCRACFDGEYPIPVPHAMPADDRTTLPVLELAAHGA
jgi:amidophosphoribosyltransferase